MKFGVFNGAFVVFSVNSHGKNEKKKKSCEDVKKSYEDGQEKL